MNKEKDIEKMTEYLMQNGIFNNLICRQDYAYPDAMIYECCRQTAELLINSGIGNIKQAVQEFAEKFKKEFLKHFPNLFTDAIYQCIDSELDNLITELYGADE